MLKIKWLLCTAAGLTLAVVSTASAAPLLYVDVLGSTTYDSGGSGYTNNLNASPGATVYFEINAISAGTTASNSHNAAQPNGTSDGVNSLPAFTLTDSSGGSFASATTTTAFTATGSQATISSSGGNNNVLTLRAVEATSGFYASTDGAAGVIIATGSLTVSSSPTSDSQSYKYSSTTGHFQVSSTILTINSATETGTNPNDPYLGYEPLTVAVTPEPASLGFLAIGGLAMLRRRRSVRTAVVA